MRVATAANVAGGGENLVSVIAEGDGLRLRHVPAARGAGTHFTCFTGTKVQILTQLRGQIKPGGYDMLWLVQDFETAIRSELDCEHEARNCEIAARYAVYLL